MKRSVKLFREYLAPDAILLALDDPRIYKGKDDRLEYIRLVEQRTDLEKLEANIEDLKISGDAAVVLERAARNTSSVAKRFTIPRGRPGSSFVKEVAGASRTFTSSRSRRRGSSAKEGDVAPRRG